MIRAHPLAYIRRTGLVGAASLAVLLPGRALAQGNAASAQALRAVPRLAPNAFPQLPRAVRHALAARGCTIPQSAWTLRPHNVASGRFTGSTRHEWAVLCARGDSAHILVFHGRSPLLVDSLAQQPLARSLVPAGRPGMWVYERQLSRVTPAEIRDMAAAYSDPLPQCLDRDGLSDAPSDKSSVVWYRLGARWRALIGGGGGDRVSGEDQTGFTAPCGRQPAMQSEMTRLGESFKTATRPRRGFTCCGSVPPALGARHRPSSPFTACSIRRHALPGARRVDYMRLLALEALFAPL